MGTALLQRGGCFLVCLSLLLLGCWAELGSGLEFPGAEGQWTRFPKWNACCESEMSFQLKTRSARGLVLYFDDEGFCDFLELILTRGGRLQLSFSIFCAEPATLLADTPVNDGAWHSVRIRRQFRNTTLFIDQVEAKWVEVKSKRRDMTVFSGLFVGGLPPELRAAALKLTLASVREREPFKGWIRDVRVNSSQALPVDSGEVKLDDEPPNSGGGSPCEAGEEGEGGVCLNGGVCSVVDDQAVCDCSRTGFRGKDCSQGKAGRRLSPGGLGLGRARGGRARQARAGAWGLPSLESVSDSVPVKTCFGCLCLITSHSPSLGVLVMVEQPPFPGSVPPGSPFYQPYFLTSGRENDLSSSLLWFFAQPLPIFIGLGRT
ncbi:hypothetical protein J1605_011154 [Eschrichtius robustus]|uniref:Neurexin-1 n=1 Tax=Eschrichtius robustus TaxID=9764 RepID=A0AB34GRT7_ESCRO|nr:hypothetical protein J1605_011154 [Eschrichtius robustus]